MFTGIIHHSGKLKGFREGRKKFVVEAPEIAGRAGIGDSIAVDGVCLSVVGADGRLLTFDLSPETLSKTTLGSLPAGARLNLELPLTLQTPLGGHMMTGHVDFVTRVKRIVLRRQGRRLVLALPAAYRPFFIPKGSVGVNGVSLTVAALTAGVFEVELVPVTLDKSNLAGLKPGSTVNVECDMVGKYVYNRIFRHES